MNLEDRPLLTFNLTGYDDEGNYIGIEEEARRLCELAMTPMYTEKEDLVPMRVRESNPDGSLLRIGTIYPDGSFVEEVQGE